MVFDGYDMVLIGIGEEFSEAPDALKAYNKLAEDLKGKNYFIVSLCMDDIIYDSNLDSDRIVSPLGGKRKKQCPDACENSLYDIDKETCPICGKPLIYNNLLAENYIEAGYLPMWEKHKRWLTGTLNKSLYILELGVSMRLPQIVRWPFERVALLNNKAFFLRVNEKLPQINAELKDKGKGIAENSVKWLIEN
jgi:hypothetical protein